MEQPVIAVEKEVSKEDHGDPPEESASSVVSLALDEFDDTPEKSKIVEPKPTKEEKSGELAVNIKQESIVKHALIQPIFSASLQSLKELADKRRVFRSQANFSRPGYKIPNTNCSL